MHALEPACAVTCRFANLPDGNCGRAASAYGYSALCLVKRFAACARALGSPGKKVQIPLERIIRHIKCHARL